MRLPGDIAEPHLDRQRLPVGILRRIRVARHLIGHAGLMPESGDAARLVQAREARAGLRKGVQCLPVTALMQPDGAERAMPDGNVPFVTALLDEGDGRLVGRRRFVEPAQVEQTLASFGETDGTPSRAAPLPSSRAIGLEALPGLVQQRQRRLGGTGGREYPGQQKAGHCRVIIGLRIGRLARCPGALKQRLGTGPGSRRWPPASCCSMRVRSASNAGMAPSRALPERLAAASRTCPTRASRRGRPRH